MVDVMQLMHRYIEWLLPAFLPPQAGITTTDSSNSSGSDQDACNSSSSSGGSGGGAGATAVVPVHIACMLHCLQNCNGQLCSLGKVGEQAAAAVRMHLSLPTTGELFCIITAATSVLQSV
jgi:hypothetical protein